MIAETSREAPVYLLTPAVVLDSYGDPSYDWGNATQVRIPNGHIQTHATLDADQAEGSTTDTTATLIAVGPRYGALAQIANESRVVQGDVVWRVYGDPNYKPGLMFGNGHLTASLRRKTTGVPNA